MTSFKRAAAVVSLALGFAIAASGAPLAIADEVTASPSQAVNLTVYNQNFGLVKDIRTIELKDGINYLRLEDIAAQIDPTTVSFISLTAPNSVTVREQNYQYDLVNPTTILNKSVGKSVKIRQYLPGGAVHEITGTLLSAPLSAVSDINGSVATHYSGLVVRTASGVVLNPSGETELAELPAGLVSRPSLFWKLEADKGGKQRAEISYQTSGLNWRCDYVAVVNDDDTLTDLTSWVTLDNKSGATYKDAGLKLIAGDVHRLTNQAVPRAFAGGMRNMALVAAPQFQEQSFAEYHMYSLQNKTDLHDNETKQLSLFNANKVPTKKRFIFEPEQSSLWSEGAMLPRRDPSKVIVKLEMSNSAANNLGMPLPKGKVRVYKRDKDGALQFIGEDMIDHTPKDEKIRLFIGDAFDLVGERTQTNMQQVSNRMQKASYEIVLRNHKQSAATVTAVEHAYGDWKIQNESQPYAKRDSHTFEFEVTIPAGGEAKINYDIQTKS